MRVRYLPRRAFAAGILIAAILGMSCTRETGNSAPTTMESTASGNVEIDWCVEHRVPESECTRCTPALISVYKEKQDWCAGHDLPESHCYLCNPGLAFPQEAAWLKGQEVNLQSTGPKPGTSLFRSNTAVCATNDVVIQFNSPETAARAGIVSKPVLANASAETITIPAEVDFDAGSASVLSARVRGTLNRWVVEPGERIQTGQIVAWLESAEAAALIAALHSAESSLALSQASLERKRILSEDSLISLAELQEAEAAWRADRAELQSATTALRLIGQTTAELASPAHLGPESGRIPVKAFADGILVEQRVTQGASLEVGSPLGTIAQTGRLWIEARVRERDLPRIARGQQAEILSEGLVRGAGRVSWVADLIDPVTRMGRVRVEAQQERVVLRLHQFVQVRITIAPVEAAILIPVEAVQWEGCCNVVFVEEAVDRFRPRKIQVQYVRDGRCAVTGLKAGEQIVTRGSFLLKTEIMKSSIGAGCCGVGA